MTTISITLPDRIARASQNMAKKMGISRTQFIKIAISHELENVIARTELEAMAQSLLALKNSKEYLAEAEEIMEGLNSELPEDEPEWWNKKS
jgi:predicted transcriptional regulator